MNYEFISLRAFRDPFRGMGGISLFGFEKKPDGSVAHLQPAVLEQSDPFISCPPLVTLTEAAAQKLMDSLWNEGIRPSNGEGNVGQIGALKYHLEDMRRLVFKSPDPEVQS